MILFSDLFYFYDSTVMLRHLTDRRFLLFLLFEQFSFVLGLFSDSFFFIALYSLFLPVLANFDLFGPVSTVWQNPAVYFLYSILFRISHFLKKLTEFLSIILTLCAAVSSFRSYPSTRSNWHHLQFSVQNAFESNSGVRSNPFPFVAFALRPIVRCYLFCQP